MTLTSLIYKALYWYISTVDKNKEITFMNYGYHDPSELIELDSRDENNRYSIQLYHRLAKMADIKDKNIVEVGCGRGGGLAYITNRFKPVTALGIDLDSKAVKFGNANYNLKGLSFKQGNAQHLDLEDGNTDVLFNVESSHRYMNMEQFLKEVYRCLKPGGYFLLTDFRPHDKMHKLNKLFKKFDFIKFDEQIINKEVSNALELDSVRRIALVEKYAPMFLTKLLHDFAGSTGSTTFNYIENGKLVYFVYCFQKPL
ncbi:MAG: class I SAM-dependent methyltransferase [Paludibacter sp.]|nr:class I SAM-dependent methyltransferase [Paludibacter sp.]